METMRGMRGLLLFALLLMGLGRALAAPMVAARTLPEHDRGGTPTTASGVYQVTINLTVASALPANSTIVCKAAIVPVVRGLDEVGSLPFESASSVATVSGGTGSCVVEIPFAWVLRGGSNGVTLNLEEDAVNASGALPVVVRTSVQQGVAAAYPTAGATSSLSYNVTF
jgi:hypothetical protein